VSYDSAAESVGILRGDMIVSLDEQHAMTLPPVKNIANNYIFFRNSCKVDITFI